METIFEKIIAREIPADIIYEDDTVVSFLDIRPIVKGHALVVPRKKYINVYDIEPDVFGHMIQVAQKVAIAQKKITGAKGATILMNNEHEGGQEVFHAHIHVIPRFNRGEAFIPAQHLSYESGESEALALQIKSLLS